MDGRVWLAQASLLEIVGAVSLALLACMVLYAVLTPFGWLLDKVIEWFVAERPPDPEC